MKKITVAVIVIFTVVVSSVIYFKSFKSEKKEIEITPTPTQILPTITQDIKVELIPQNNNRVIALKISGLTADLESVEYELTYLTGNNLPRGVLGKISLNGESQIERGDIVLGTCSSGKCVYDSGVESIDLSLKFNSKLGVSVYRNTYNL